LPVYFFTQQYEGYYVVAGLIIGWSVEQLFIFSKIDNFKEKERGVFEK